MSEQDTPSWPSNPAPQPIDRVPQAQEPTSGDMTTARSIEDLAQSYAPVSRILTWLGVWRDKMPAEAVDHLHAICDASANPTLPASPVYIPGDPNALDTEPKMDVASIFALASRQPLVTLTAEQARTLIEALRDSAMEAECGHELGGYRVTLLARHGLTDSSDPAFGPVKYPDQGKPQGDVEPF